MSCPSSHARGWPRWQVDSEIEKMVGCVFGTDFDSVAVVAAFFLPGTRGTGHPVRFEGLRTGRKAFLFGALGNPPSWLPFLSSVGFGTSNKTVLILRALAAGT